MAILYQKLQFADEDDRLTVHEFLARNELLFFWTFQKKEERRESGLLFNSKHLLSLPYT